MNTLPTRRKSVATSETTLPAYPPQGVMGPPKAHPGEETLWTPDRVMQGSALAVVSFCLILVIAGGLVLALAGRLDAYRWLQLVAGILTTLIGFVFGYLFRGAGGRSAPPQP